MHASRISVGASLLTVAFGACLLGPAAPAGAAFPGTNGRIAFDRGVSGQFNIVSTLADGTGLKQLAADARLPRYDAKGARIVFLSVSAGISNGIRVMNSDGTNKHTVTTNANDTEPTWAPGGGQIAFVRGNTLMAIHPDGTSRRTIKTFATAVSAPSWAPGGGRIAFSRFVTADNTSHIATIRPDGTGLTTVPHTANCINPDWSPNGTRLAFTCQTPASVLDIYVAHPDGTGKFRVTKTNTVREFRPTWSPNGARLLYWIIERGALFTIKPDGSGRVNVRAVQAQAVASTWQPR